MNQGDDWSRLAQTWQQQPAVDAGRLRRDVQRKRQRMRVVMGLRVVGACVVVVLLTRLQLAAGIPVPMRIWGAVMFPVFALILYLRVRQYRGTWDAAGERPGDLLRLTARRAEAGIRLAWTNIAAIVLVAVVSLAFAAPYLAPARWAQDPAARQVLTPLITVNGGLAMVAVVLNVWYMHRQRVRLRGIGAMLKEAAAADDHQP